MAVSPWERPLRDLRGTDPLVTSLKSRGGSDPAYVCFTSSESDIPGIIDKSQ